VTAGPPEESPPTERRSPTLLEQMGGVPGTIYDVTLRIRGIVEANVYTGGTSSMNGFYIGGAVGGNEGGSQYSQYSLQVSSPATTYHLNQLDPGAQQDKYKNPTNGGANLPAL